MSPSKPNAHKMSTIIMVSCIVMMALLMLVMFFTAYGLFFESTKGAVDEQVEELTNQIIYNFQSYIDSVVTTANFLQVRITETDLKDAANYASVVGAFEYILQHNSEVAGIGVYSLDSDNYGEVILHSDGAEVGNAQHESWFVSAIADDTIYWFQTLTDNNLYIIDVSRMITLSGGRQAVMKIQLNSKRFATLASLSNLGDEGHIVIIDNAYSVVYTSSTNSSLLPQEIDRMRNIILGAEDIVYNDIHMNLTIDTLSNTQWRLCVYVNIEQLAIIERNFIVSMIFGVLALFGIGMAVLMTIIKNLTQPLAQLERAMAKIETNNYIAYQDVELRHSREVESLSRSFNIMMRRINELFEKVIKEQTAQRVSELKALQNQINPHFLYNTMDSIMWLIEQNKNQDAAQMLSALAKLFRISISRGRNVVSVTDELEHIKNYIYIQSVRYQNAFECVYDIDPEAYQYTSLKLVIQPVVENCLYHGLRENIHHGIITITVKVDNNKLSYIVSDNGLGISQEKIDSLYQVFRNPDLNDGVGLKNIYQRLMLYYGQQAELNIASNLDEGTTITIVQPLITFKETDSEKN